MSKIEKLRKIKQDKLGRHFIGIHIHIKPGNERNACKEPTIVDILFLTTSETLATQIIIMIIRFYNLILTKGWIGCRTAKDTRRFCLRYSEL